MRLRGLVGCSFPWLQEGSGPGRGSSGYARGKVMQQQQQQHLDADPVACWKPALLPGLVVLIRGLAKNMRRCLVDPSGSRATNKHTQQGEGGHERLLLLASRRSSRERARRERYGAKTHTRTLTSALGFFRWLFSFQCQTRVQPQPRCPRHDQGHTSKCFKSIDSRISAWRWNRRKRTPAVKLLREETGPCS